MKLIPNLADIDRKAVQQAGISAASLMEQAGSKVAQAVQARCGKFQHGVIVCGPGNNGGDGFVCARVLHRAGYQKLSVVFTGTSYRAEALANLEQLMGLPIEMIQARQQPELALGKVCQADFIVDALFGSGLNRPIEGVEASLVEAINATRQAWVLAVDIPSGIDGATGQIVWKMTGEQAGCAVHAHHTVTFATGKPGLWLFPGRVHAGRIEVVDIGIPTALIAEDESPLRLITRDAAQTWLPRRKSDSHKYDYGHLLVVAGSQPMPGAAVLCAEAAMSAGTGLVTLAAPSASFQAAPLMPEIMRLPLPHASHLTPDAIPILEAALDERKINTVLLGPGLGRDSETFAAIQALLELCQARALPVILDADGLNALAAAPRRLHEPCILTPHLGEAARLLNEDKTTLSLDLPAAADRLRARYGCQIVLKAATTLIATTDNLCWLSPTGNPGMATAGSGDVLSGIIGAITAQTAAQKQNATTDAAKLGVYLHGLAGDAAAQSRTVHAMRASDITAHLPNAFKVLLHSTDEGA